MEPADEVAEPSQGDVAAEPRRQRVSSGPSYEDVLGAVDEIYHDIEDPGLATVGDVKRHVAKRFGWEKCSEFMSKLIKLRLTDLVNGNGDPDEVTTPKERKTDTCTKDEPPRPMSPLELREILDRVLLCLGTESRSRLRRCSRALRRAVTAFDRRLIESPECARECSATRAARRELVRLVDERRWMPRRAGAGGGLVPGPSNLRRLTAGDHLLERAPPWECGDDGQYDRVIGFYDSAKLIDDNLWVLYSDYFDKFEIINIDTGRGVKHFYPENGPGDYESHYESRISLLLTCYGGRHGMLAAGMDSSKRRNPHGAWSGPYMSLWNISPSNPESPTNRKPVMSIDLCRSSYTIVAVSVVSTERVCILLSGPDGVELQWHRIPQNADEMHRGRPPHPQPDRPGAAPPPHQCSSACPFMRRCPEKQKMDVWKSSKEFWQEYDARAPNSTAASEKKYSYESRCEYIWWPGQSTLLQADSITRKNVNSATMESDGGMLVIVADAVLQLWHCGTMSNLRDVSPFLIYEESFFFYPSTLLHSLDVHTIVRPFEDVKGRGEGHYYVNGTEPVPTLEETRNFQTSTNPIDISTCDATTLLSRFAHHTFDEQRDFERQHSLEVGSCSPQLDCIVRVAFAISQKDESSNYIMVLELRPFHHVRNRQSLEYNHDDCTVEEELEQYNEACKTGRLWCSTLTSYYSCREDGMESVYMLCWERGGLFDFEDGPSDQSRLERLTGALAHLQLQNQAIEPSLRMYGDIGQEIFKQRGTSSLAIDSSKLVVCTRYEVAVMPFSLTTESSPSLDEEWVDTFDEESNQYLIGRETPLWYSARPLHSNFLRQWNSIRMSASRSYSPDEPANAFRSVAEEMSISLDYEKELMKVAVLCSPMIRSACISWRRLALVTSSFDDNLDGHHLLHVYDILCDWTDSTGGRFDVEERGVGFSEDTEEDDTEEDDTEEDDTEEDD